MEIDWILPSILYCIMLYSYLSVALYPLYPVPRELSPYPPKYHCLPEVGGEDTNASLFSLVCLLQQLDELVSGEVEEVAYMVTSLIPFSQT